MFVVVVVVGLFGALTYCTIAVGSQVKSGYSCCSCTVICPRDGASVDPRFIVSVDGVTSTKRKYSQSASGQGNMNWCSASASVEPFEATVVTNAQHI